MHPDDEVLYADFLNLKDGSQKWIGIGGWEFSDAGATRNTWSQMASSKTNRAAFISSLQKFLDKWNFRGVDIDWEWPGAESRGGNPAIDMRNQIDLMVELRQALGSRGLSVVLPAQYEYLKHLDPKALEAQVDHFNVLSYDLHGPWDATIPGEGALIKPHTDLQEIDTALTLFWFNDVSPAKINLGIANYGRGYTVADPNCSKYGCAWTGPSKAGECTQLDGVLSQCEIQRLIRAKNLNPEIIAGGAGVKQVSFDGQWVGYDDSETLALKTELANLRCLGGTALWAVDYASCRGGPDAPVMSSSVLLPSKSGGSGVPSSVSNVVPGFPVVSSTPVVSVAPSSTSISAPAISPTASTVPGPAQPSLETSSVPSSTHSSAPTETETGPSATVSSAISTTGGSSTSVQSPKDSSLSTTVSVTTLSTAQSETASSAILSTGVPIVPPSGSSASSASVSSAPLSSKPLSSVPMPSSPASSTSASSVQGPPAPVSSVVGSSVQGAPPQATSTSMSASSIQGPPAPVSSVVGSSVQGPSVPASSVSASSIQAPPAQKSSASASGSSVQGPPAPASSVSASSVQGPPAPASSLVGSSIQGPPPQTPSISGSSVQMPFVSLSTGSSTASPTTTILGSSTSTGSSQSSQSSATTIVASSASGSAPSSSVGGSAGVSSSASGSGSASSESSSASGSSSQTATETTSSSEVATTASSRSSGSDGQLSSTATSSGQASASGSSGAQLSQSLSVTTATVTSWDTSLSQATTTITRDFSQSGEQSSGTTAASASLSQASSNVASSGVSSASSGSGGSSAVTSWAPTTGASGTYLESISSGGASSNAATSNPAQTFSPSSQATNGGSSAVMSSGAQTSSNAIISIPTSNAAGTQSGEGTTTKNTGTTGGGSIATPSTAQGSTGTATPTSSRSAAPLPTGLLREVCPKCPEAAWCNPLANKNVKELPAFPPPECLDNQWCTECWPKPPEFNVEICPLECWLLDWCKPLCGLKGDFPVEPPEKGLKLKWFTLWWWKLPVKGCVPNDCKSECVAWYGLTLAVFKRPICPCVPRTCTKGEDKENKDKKKCKLFGCGCGWMGLPFGPGCVDIHIDWPKIFPWGFFGQNPCKWFGGCKFPPGTKPPPGPPPEDDNPNNDDFGDEGCGPFGCRSYCYNEGGCEPCPTEICGGPKCTKPGGCGPKTGPDPKPEPTRKSKCEENQKTTVTERLVSCFIDLKLEPTTIKSLNYTLTETLTSACVSFEATYTGCGILGTSTTTTISSFTTNSSSSEAPMCTRAPLNLDNDEGDNEQPTKTTDGPSCTRAPLSLDDDEGDNEQPKSSEAPACTRAPLSLDDDEGDNEMPADMSSSLSMSRTPTPSANSSVASSTSMSMTSSLSANSTSATSSTPASSSFSSSRVLPPSTLSMPATLPPWGSGIPSGTPTPGNCGSCKSHFDKVANEKCKPDGSDAEACAKWSLADLCFGKGSPDYCKTGSCKHSACPKEDPGDYSKANPAGPFTTVLSLSSTTVTVTATPSKTTASLSASATPTCKSGGSVSPHGKWTAYWEQEIKGPEASFKWTLWDENGCEAGKGSADNKQLLGADISTDIGAQHRPQEQKMGYMLHTNISDSTSSSRSEILFTISKPPAGCTEMCWARWKIANGVSSTPWQITSDCAQQCGMRKFTPTDVGCDNAINKFQYTDDTLYKKRGGYCWWRMPFEPADDNPPPPPPPITRDSIWRLEIRQQMQYTKGEIEWTLYDPNKQKAGSGLQSTSNPDAALIAINTSPGAQTMHYAMQLAVSKPLNKDKSRITISYVGTGKLPGCTYGTTIGHLPECNPYYRTETDDEVEMAILNDCYTEVDGVKYICDRHLVTNQQMSCDAIPRAFRPKNAGFERKFSCSWPHDFKPQGEKGVAGAEAMDGGVDGFQGGVNVTVGGGNGSWTNGTIG
ncbi:Chitinase [Ascochyta lentis]